jgi:hypothetical protein
MGGWLWLAPWVAGQRLSPRTRELVAHIRHENVLRAERVGVAATVPEQYMYFEALRDQASEEELLRLVRHPNEVVSTYAGWALIDRRYADLAGLYRCYARRMRAMTVQHGCIVGRNYPPLEFQSHLHERRLLAQNPADSAFYRRQSAAVDSLIIAQAPRWTLITRHRAPLRRLANRALESNAAAVGSYVHVKALAKRQPYGLPLVALAEYRRPEDVAFIGQQGYHALAAIARFPAPEFWPWLSAIDPIVLAADKDHLPAYYRAVISYQNTASARLLQTHYTAGRLPALSQLVGILESAPSSVYDSLQLSLWRTHKLLTLPAANRLSRRCPQAAAASFAAGLLAPGSYKELSGLNYRVSDTLITFMLEHVQRHRPVALPAICAANIATTDFLLLKQFLDFTRQHQLTSCQAAVMQHMAREGNSAFDLFHLVETALAFNDPTLKPRIERMLTANRAAWDWGNWSVSFKKLLTAHNIELPARP